jgi:hypothetical protein
MPIPKGRKMATSITLTSAEVEMAKALKDALGFNGVSALVGYLIREKYREVFGAETPPQLEKTGPPPDPNGGEPEVLEGRFRHE